MEQKLFYLPEGIDVGAQFKKVAVEFPHSKPKKLWALFGYTDQAKPPELPYAPVHHENAFIMDYIHDYDFFEEKGKTFIKYHGSEDGGFWLLLEF